MQNQLSVNQVSVGQDYQLNLQTSLKIHLVEREDVFYTKGRNLAKAVYKEVWNTENLVDGNDYGIVVVQDGKVLGNTNIQLRKPGKKLKSEIFFGEHHWQDYFEADDFEVGEISAFSIAQDAPTELRRPIMMMLLTGMQTICRIKGIGRLATVQHPYLFRILHKSLHLPLYKNQEVTQPIGNLPNDNYWKKSKPPSIYYLDILGSQMINISYSFLSYLNMLGIETNFLPRIQEKKDLSYSSFVKQWNQHIELSN